MRSYLLAASALALFSHSATAQIFECTNAAGVKEFAQFCPPGTVQQRQVVKPGDNAPAPANAPKSPEVQDAEYKMRLKERQEREAQADQERTRADEAERNCTEARSNLQLVQDGARLQRFDPATGERVFYSEEDRAAEIERQGKAVATWCK